MWLLKSIEDEEVLRVNLLDPIDLYDVNGKRLGRKAIFRLAYPDHEEKTVPVVYMKRAQKRWIRLPIYENNVLVGETTRVSTKRTLKAFRLTPE